MALGEHHRDVGDLGEDVEVGRQAGDRAVEEHHVLDVQHQLLGHPGAVAEQCLDDPLHLLDQLVAGQRGRVDRRLVEAAGRGSPRRGRCRRAARRGRAAPPAGPSRRWSSRRPSAAGTPAGARRSAGRRCRSRAARCGRRAARTGCRRAGRRGRCRTTIAPSMNATIAVRTTASVSTPASFMPATSSKLKPSRRSITSTRRVTSVGCGRGTT